MEKDEQSKDLAESCLADSCPLGVNEAGSGKESDAPLTQDRSLHVRGYVYFIRAAEAIKIGFSKNPPERLAELQTSNAEQLTLIGSFKGERSDEKELHGRFCHLRLRGEWFRDEEELTDFIYAKARRLPKVPAPSPETFAAIAGLIKQRNAYGADTPIGHRHSNLAEMLRYYEHAQGDQRAHIGAGIARTVREIGELRARTIQ